jgi:preprotein translocase subunit SecF
MNIYDKQYKLLIALSMLVLLASIGVLAVTKATTGEFFQKGVSLKGGLAMTVPVSEANVDALEAAISKQFPKADVSVRGTAEAGRLKALIIEASGVTEEEIVPRLQEHGIRIGKGSYSSEIIGSALGESFYRQTVIAVLLAFLFMAVSVFITFRSPLPSMLVILALASEITSTVAVVNLLGIKLSAAGVASFLMIIGYAVDTNILLTVKVLRQKDRTIFQRTIGAMRTGLLMSFTAIAATIIGYTVIESDMVKQIMLIITIGLFFDIIYTWFQNAGILRLCLERKQARAGTQHGGGQ